MAVSPEIVRLKITLDGIKPTVIRRIEVPVLITLDALHEVIQAIMPWENSHMHAFYPRLIDGPRWSPPSPYDDDFADFGIETRDSTRTSLANVLAEPNFKMLRYNYDFGDDWRHTIKVESRLSAEPADRYPTLIDAKGRCPPENCGGPWGYAEYLDAISDPTHKRHAELKGWIGDFDPTVIDRVALEAALRRLAKAPPTTNARKRSKRASKS
jgi:Plasmid pRiA4b ORF-3-like protein